MSLIKYIHRLMSRFTKEQRGIAAVEFAMAAPILILLCFGGYEVSRNMMYQIKLEKMAFTIADVTAQNESLTNAQINDIFKAAEQIFLPDVYGNNGIVFITSVYRAEGDLYPKVLWQRSGGGTSLNTSLVGSVGLTATLPAGLTLNPKDNVIVVEAYYTYNSVVTLGGMFSRSTLIRKTSYFKPRLGALTTNPT